MAKGAPLCPPLANFGIIRLITPRGFFFFFFCHHLIRLFSQPGGGPRVSKVGSWISNDFTCSKSIWPLYFFINVSHLNTARNTIVLNVCFATQDLVSNRQNSNPFRNIEPTKYPSFFFSNPNYTFKPSSSLAISLVLVSHL